MKIRYIAVAPIGMANPDQYTRYARLMAKNMNFICDWLSKAVRKLDIMTDKINMLDFYPSQKDNKVYIEECFSCLSGEIMLPMEEMIRLHGMTRLEDRYEFYLSFLEKGYVEASKLLPLPIDSLLSLHEQFRSNGYKNEWLFKKKKIREYGLTVFLNCYLTTFDFHLELEAYDLKQTHLMAKGVIFRTCPNRLCFADDFRSIKIEGSKLQILNFVGHLEMVVDLELLAQGKVVVEYIDGEFLQWEERKSSDAEAIKRITW